MFATLSTFLCFRVIVCDWRQQLAAAAETKKKPSVLEKNSGRWSGWTTATFASAFNPVSWKLIRCFQFLVFGLSVATGRAAGSRRNCWSNNVDKMQAKGLGVRQATLCVDDRTEMKYNNLLHVIVNSPTKHITFYLKSLVCDWRDGILEPGWRRISWWKNLPSLIGCRLESSGSEEGCCNLTWLDSPKYSAT